MIKNQRELFEIPEEVTYLNCAYTGPLLKTAAAAGVRAVEAKKNPWTIRATDFFDGIEHARSLFSQVIGCEPNDVALVPAVSYGIALAAKNLPVSKGQSIVVIQDQFPSNVYSWRRVADQTGATIKTVRRPSNGDWTPALLEAVDDFTAIVAVPNCHWTDGTLIDLVAVGERCREVGAALVVDGIQSVGAMPFSVDRVRPDFLAVASHKWLLGAYSFGFCYVDPKWHDAVPLEENWLNRAGSEDFSRLVDYADGYQDGARRYDVGEVSNFMLTPIASAALEQILEWGVENIAQTLRAKTNLIANRAEEIGLSVAPPDARAPHLIGINKEGGFGKEVPGTLARERVFVSVRGECIRVSPHLYNTDADIERFFSVLRAAIGS